MTREVEAEGIAYTVCQHFGLDTSEYSFPYIAGWSSSKDAKELKSSLDTIRKTASELIDGIEGSLKEKLRSMEAEKDKPYIDHFYVIDDLSTRGTFKLQKHQTLEPALTAYFVLPTSGMKALGICNSNDLPGSLDFIHCISGKDTMIQDYTKVEGWNRPEVSEVVEQISKALEEQRHTKEKEAEIKPKDAPVKAAPEAKQTPVAVQTYGRQPGPKESVLKALRERQAAIKKHDAEKADINMQKKGEHAL